ncbi:hypothetical protein BC830DRAFT_1168852 [Chytriomyces sp. MP71]|nr:hypothetical protein BC830DRAFT_1168852 [Chytriomyces sp. MP71]
MHSAHSLPPIQMPRQPAFSQLNAEEARLLDKATWSYPLRHAPSPLASPVGPCPPPQDHHGPKLPYLKYPGIRSPDEGPRPVLSQQQTRSRSHQSPPISYRFSHATPVAILPSSTRFSPYAHPSTTASHQRRSSDVQAQVNTLNQSLHDSVALSCSSPRSQLPMFKNRARLDSDRAVHREIPQIGHLCSFDEHGCECGIGGSL